MRRAFIIGSLAIGLTVALTAADEIKDPNPPVLTLGMPPGSGGPDPFGYTFLDSTDPDGPRYFWLDISGTGTPAPLDDDDHLYPIDIGFDFEFYGVTYDQVAIGSNGTLYFIDEYLGLTNTCIPGSTDYLPQTFVAGYWDDLELPVPDPVDCAHATLPDLAEDLVLAFELLQRQGHRLLG